MSAENIPDDVMEMANGIIRKWEYDWEEDSEGEDLDMRIARAILAERQRCADVAQKVIDENNTGSGFDSYPAYSAAFDIREAIRNPSAK